MRKRIKLLIKIAVFFICLILPINSLLIISSIPYKNLSFYDYSVKAHLNSRSESSYDMILYITSITDGFLSPIMESDMEDNLHSGVLIEDLEYEWESIEAMFLESGFVIYSGTIKFEMYFSSTPSIDSITFSSSLFKISNDNEALISNSEAIGNINTEITQINLIFNITENIILKESEKIKLSLTISFSSPTLVTELIAYKGPSHPFGIHFKVEKPFNINISETIVEERGYIEIDVDIEDPLHIIQWGTYDPNIHWNGPTTPISVENLTRNFWIWYYEKDNAMNGDYTFFISITDFQEHTINAHITFTIKSMENENNNENNGNHVPENNSDENNGDDNNAIPCFETLFFLLGLILVVLFSRKRRSIKSVPIRRELNQNNGVGFSARTQGLR